VDAVYEKVREAGQVRDAAVLIATGITPQGERQVLGVSASLSEHEGARDEWGEAGDQR